MKLRKCFAATSAAGIILTASSLVLAQTSSSRVIKSGYAPVNGLNIYYETHGTGAPLILLHGGLGSTEMFSDILPLLADSPGDSRGFARSRANSRY